mmetsp:Transcript_27521/g.37918  ORF Transcript_27521/g.37918 Transcript_27521/m.37918 type:complete len:485 (-) Transcript_27521:134-1588(-)
MIQLYHHQLRLSRCLSTSYFDNDHHQLITCLDKQHRGRSTIQGPVIAFNLSWSDGRPVGFSEVGRRAEARGVQLRTGCFCNVGACQLHLGLSSEALQQHMRAGRVCGADEHDLVNGRHTGAVRVSLGFSTGGEDCRRFLRFLTDCFLDQAPARMSPTLPAWGGELSKELLYRYPESDGDPADSVGSGADSVEGLVVAALLLYPIKSCGGMRVSRWPLTRHGLLFDRQWTVVDRNGRAVTQKTHPMLSRVQTAVDLHARCLVVRAPADMHSEPLLVPLDEDGPAGGVADMLVKVCGSSRRGWATGPQADQWFTTALRHSGDGQHYRLVRQRPVSGPSDSSGQRSFSNQAPLLLLSEESVSALVALIAAELGGGRVAVENFRPNLVVAGCVPHEEDQWGAVDIATEAGLLRLEVSGPCSRCSMVNVSGSSGSFDCRAFEALSEYRKKGHEVHFGQFLRFPAGEGTKDDGVINMLAVGNKVHAIKLS